MKKSEKSFEETMAALEELISKLESGSVPLEEMVALHERGMALYESCAKELAAFEKRLKIPGTDA